MPFQKSPWKVSESPQGDSENPDKESFGGEEEQGGPSQEVSRVLVTCFHTSLCASQEPCKLILGVP